MDKTEKYISNLGRMVRHETISAYDQTDLTKYREFHKLLAELFPSLWSRLDVEEHEGSLLMKWKGESSDHPVLFMNHHDVVDAEGIWTHPPFSGEVFDGKLWGRGTLDTKGGLWGMLQAADELAESGFVPKNDIWFESSCNEETEGLGASYFSEELYNKGIRFDYVLDEGGMITYEPISGAKGSFAMIGMGEKGASDLKFTAHGLGGHGSSPELNTPLVRLGKFMAEADKGKVFEAELAPVLCEMLRRLAPSYSGAMKFVYGHPELFKSVIKNTMVKMAGTARALVQSTVAFTIAEGSNGRNVIPTDAYVFGNMRSSHHQGFEKSLKAIKELADKYDIETTVVEAAIDSKLADYNTPEFKMIEAAVGHAFTDVTPVPYIMTGCSDARFMGKLSDNCFHFVPFIIDAQQLESIHGIDENVDVTTLAPAVEFYKYLMSNR